SEAKRKWGLEHVILSATHTHSGPNLQASPWYSAMEDKVIAAIGAAMQKMFRARVGAGQCRVGGPYFAYNRRLVESDGSVTMLWTNPSRRPVGPVDPTARIIRIDDNHGKPRAVMVNYAAHAVVLGTGNLHISADYPGAMVNYIEREMGGTEKKCMAMFLQGGGGDVHPYEAVLDGNSYGFEIVRQTGNSIGHQVLRAVKKIKTHYGRRAGSIAVGESILTIARRDDPGKSEEVGVLAVMINESIALAAVSGEPFVQHQLDLAAKSAVKNTLLLGYSFFGRGIPLPTYLPSRQAVSEGGYGADGRVNFLENGAGEKMIETAVALIGRLSPQPNKPPAVTGEKRLPNECIGCYL
ncbi:MAG: hypothetical protein WC299_05430, partial [Kiritimatiellia bacterium]